MSDYAAHIVSRIQADIDFLQDAGHLRAQDADQIRHNLAAASTSSSNNNAAALSPSPASSASAVSAIASRASAVTSRFAQLAVNKRSPPTPPVAGNPAVPTAAAPAEPQQELARAIWTYSAAPGANDELSFEEGDTLVVVERTSADWWKGYILSRPSEPKLYPSNYVEAIAAPVARTLPPAYGYSASSPPASSEKSESAFTLGGRLIPKARFSSGGPPPPQSQQQQQAQAGPSSGNPNGVAGLTPVMTEEEKKKKNAGMKKLGGTMAHGAAGGVGFGVGVGLVNAIF
ncbi:hypothetical protein V8E36_009315 [Tilletia maclaganii]